MKLIADIMAWQAATFPNQSRAGAIAHARAELIEIEQNPGDLSEPVDLIFMAIDIARRDGHTADEVAEALAVKLAINKSRTWVDPGDPDAPMEHQR